jgi:hypothetical protein
VFKNVVIAFLLLVIGFGVAFGFAWYQQYQRIILQASTLSNFGLLANETRFLVRVHKRLDAGESEEAKRLVGEVIQVNKEDLTQLWSQIDLELDYPGQIESAKEYADILKDVGITEFSSSDRLE